MLNINSNDSQIASSYPYNNLANTKMITNDSQNSAKNANNDTVEISQQGKSKLQSSSKSSTSSSDSTTDLSSLSSSELQKLVANGTITQSEANAELAKRSNNSTSDSTGTDISQNNKMITAIEAYKVYSSKIALS